MAENNHHNGIFRGDAAQLHELFHECHYSRAIPDARDGLKPVQRRVLYDMERAASWGIMTSRTGNQPVLSVTRWVNTIPHGDSSDL
ncbi:MAG: DNA gyrase subunit A [Clostridium fessum]